MCPEGQHSFVEFVSESGPNDVTVACPGCGTLKRDEWAHHMPRRFKWASTQPWAGRPAGTVCFGVYFPATDLCVTTMGARGTGAPSWSGVEWVDSIADLGLKPEVG